MRGDESFAYDLVVRHRPVNSRQALLFGSIEGKRSSSARFVHPYLAARQPIGRGVRGMLVFFLVPAGFRVSQL